MLPLIETSRHLFQPPHYRTSSGAWERDFLAAVPSGELTWDPAAVLSLACFGYTCGDRTLVQEVRRTPWLSEVSPEGEVRLGDLPAHGLRWATPAGITSELLRRLEDELALACKDRREIYLLLSGGLDSRIVAGVLARLLEQGRLTVVPTAVTWGIEQSRDVLYGKAVADRLGFPWKYVPLEPAHLKQNAALTASRLWALGAPTHLHRMAFFESVAPDALVVAGSYGDSVGRGEFSGSSLLELRGLKPFNFRGLLTGAVAAHALDLVQQDLQALRVRAGSLPRYALMEVEQQGYYMRGMIAHMMSIINSWCTLYQAFTAPEVYGYMWSLHPAARTDEVYVELIRKLGNELVAIPWARTNRTIDAAIRPVVLHRHAPPKYHRYADWLAGECRDSVRENVDPEWFAATGLFDGGAVQRIRDDVLERSQGVAHQGRRAYDVVGWLWSLRCFARDVLPVEPILRMHPPANIPVSAAVTVPVIDGRSGLRRRLAEVPLLLRHTRRARKWWLRRQSISQLRPEYD